MPQSNSLPTSLQFLNAQSSAFSIQLKSPTVTSDKEGQGGLKDLHRRFLAPTEKLWGWSEARLGS